MSEWYAILNWCQERGITAEQAKAAVEAWYAAKQAEKAE